MNFKTISIVKFPVEETWQAMLHHLPDIANDVDELDSIKEMERTEIPGGTKVVSLWKAKPKMPDMVMKYIKPAMLEWDDIALWKESGKTIEWHIHSHHYYDELQCGGTTVFEPAMGNKGCKITFSGSLKWKGQVFSVNLGVLDNAIAKAAESVLTQVIPSNFRKITEALEGTLRRNNKY